MVSYVLDCFALRHVTVGYEDIGGARMCEGGNFSVSITSNRLFKQTNSTRYDVNIIWRVFAFTYKSSWGNVLWLSVSVVKQFVGPSVILHNLRPLSSCLICVKWELIARFIRCLNTDCTIRKWQEGRNRTLVEKYSEKCVVDGSSDGFTAMP